MKVISNPPIVYNKSNGIFGGLIMDFGLALAGGGTRGAAHVGVLLALEEANLFPTAIAGTSAGSIVAGLYAAGINSKDMKEIVMTLAKKGHTYLDIDYLGLIKFIPQIVFRQNISLTGFIKGNKLERYLCQLTNNMNIENTWIKTVIPTVDINSGMTIAYINSINGVSPVENVKWETSIPLCKVMMASSSVPAIFCPRKIGDYCFVDGGVTNNLPVNLLNAAGEQNVIAVDIGADYEESHVDNIFNIATHSFNIMSTCLKDCTSTKESLLLKLALPKSAGLLTFDHMIACMQAGYDYTKAMLPSIRAVLRIQK